MTHSPTPTELLALKTAHAAEASKDASYDLVSTIVFALGSAQLLQSPETAAELQELRARVAELEAERRTVVADRDAQIVAWLGKKAHEYGTSNAEKRAKAEAVGRMADKLSRGAVRQPLEDTYTSPLHTDYRLCHDLDLPEVPRG